MLTIIIQPNGMKKPPLCGIHQPAEAVSALSFKRMISPAPSPADSRKHHRVQFCPDSGSIPKIWRTGSFPVQPFPLHHPVLLAEPLPYSIACSVCKEWLSLSFFRKDQVFRRHRCGQPYPVGGEIKDVSVFPHFLCLYDQDSRPAMPHSHLVCRIRIR